MDFRFKKEHTPEERRKAYERINEQQPYKIPIICEKAPRSKIKAIEKTKYLVDPNLSLPVFKATIRKKLDLDEKDAIFFLINGKSSLSGNETLEQYIININLKMDFFILLMLLKKFGVDCF